MTLTELRYILALSHTKHFGKAAEACHVSQPTLSTAIQKLESKLGVVLFERDRHHIRVTDIGAKIIAQAQVVIEQVEHLQQVAEGAQSQLEAPLSIGAIYTVGPYLFPNLIPKLKKIAPSMPLLIQEDFTANLRVKLQQGELDVIFISLPFKEAGVVVQSIYEEPFVVLMQKNHPLNQISKIKTDDLKTCDVLLLGEGHCLRSQILSACPSCVGEQAKTMTVEGASLETLRHMVASGMGVTILPSSATQIHYYKSILSTKPFAGQVPTRVIALAWRSSFTRPKAITALIQALKASAMREICLLPSAAHDD